MHAHDYPPFLRPEYSCMWFIMQGFVLQASGFDTLAVRTHAIAIDDII